MQGLRIYFDIPSVILIAYPHFTHTQMIFLSYQTVDLTGVLLQCLRIMLDTIPVEVDISIDFKVFG
jgi:hypothetical protein